MQEALPTSLLITELTEVTLTDDFTETTFDIDLNNASGYGDFSELFNTLTLLFEYQLGESETSNKIVFQFENGSDEDDLYLATSASVSAGVVTLADQSFEFTGANATAPYRRSFPVEISDRFIRVSLKETGVAANYGTVSVKAFLSKR